MLTSLALVLCGCGGVFGTNTGMQVELDEWGAMTGTNTTPAGVVLSEPVEGAPTRKLGRMNPASTGHTKYMSESARSATGAYSMGSASVVAGGKVYFGTFGVDGLVQQFRFPAVASPTSSLVLEKTLRVGDHGGKYLFGAATLGNHVFFGSAITPSSIISVRIDPFQFEARLPLTLQAGLSGVVSMGIDPSLKVLIAITCDPFKAILIDVSDATAMKVLDSKVINVGDTNGSPSDRFIDTTNKFAYVASTEGCVYRVSYAGGKVLATPESVACMQYKAFASHTFDSSQGKLLIFSTSPQRRMVLFDIASRTSTAMRVTKDMSYIVGLWSDSKYAYLVGQSHRGITALFQYDWFGGIGGALSNTKCNLAISKDGCNWGMTAAGKCRLYTWKECLRWQTHCNDYGCSTTCAHEEPYQGCFYYPIGRSATGAALTAGRLFVATENKRCTICTKKERLFPKDAFLCTEEYESDDSAFAECGAVKHNARPVIWDFGMTEGDMNFATNNLYGFVNTTVVDFKLGDIKFYGDIHTDVELTAGSSRFAGLVVVQLLVAMWLL